MMYSEMRWRGVELPMCRNLHAIEDLRVFPQGSEGWRLLRIGKSARRALVAAMTGAAVVLGSAFSSPAINEFSFQIVRERARVLAAREYQPEPGAALPDFLKNLTYDQYQDIRFRPEKSLWHNEPLPFELQFFHRAYLCQESVRINLVENGRVSEVQFSPLQFNYGKNKFPKAVPENLGYAGFRIVYRPPGKEKFEEVASFLGASYFRLVGLGQRYGAAARGLAIDTGEPGGEEFPCFTEFWVEPPQKGAQSLQFYALLNSPTAAGAYRFVLHTGAETAFDVEASLFLRKAGKKIALAPLTSMFLMGQNRTRYFPDFRPQVHDSDGLLLKAGPGQWLWRPLINPEKKLHISRFPVNELGGFGLMQRARDFHDYEDLEALFELRSSLWVTPGNPWGPGTVELVELPSQKEWNDNIVVYWVPTKNPAGQELHWTYRLVAQLTDPPEPLLRVRSTRISPERDHTPPRFVIDFTKNDGASELLPLAPMEAKAQSSRGEIRNLVTQTNEVTGGWRAFFDLANAGSEPAELRLWLQRGDKVTSETWVYDYQNP